MPVLVYLFSPLLNIAELTIRNLLSVVVVVDMVVSVVVVVVKGRVALVW